MKIVHTRFVLSASACFTAAFFFVAVSTWAQVFTIISETGEHAISCVQMNGVLFAPLPQVADALQASEKTAVKHADTISSFKFGQYTISCVRDNPFVKITDSKGTSRLYQFAYEPITKQSTLFIPIRQFMDVVILAIPNGFQFDRENSIVRLIPTETKQSLKHAESPVSLEVKQKSNGLELDFHYRNSAPRSVTAEKYDARNAVVHGDFSVFDTATISFDDESAEWIALESMDKGSLRFVFTTDINAISFLRKGNTFTVLIRTSSKLTNESTNKGSAKAREKWKLDVVVIDAGHGGKDPGTQGLHGTNEKDVTLAIGLKLGAMLQREGFRVVYTRTTDTFIELHRRAEIANEAGGKLFICIHCNSMPQKPNPAHGIESYILRPGKTESAARVADRENNAVRLERDATKYEHVTEENYIIASMAQSSFVRWSERFAALVQREVTARAPILRDNGVNQAGFLVLIGASMPNILIETGYLSHPSDENFLTHTAGQKKIAEGICEAVKKYQVEYAKALAQ